MRARGAVTLVKTPLVVEMFQVLGQHFQVCEVVIRDRTYLRKINSNSLCLLEYATGSKYT